MVRSHRPDGRRRDAIVRWALLAVLLQLGLRAIAGGALLVLDPTGGTTGHSTALLDPLPVATFRLPGLVLALGFGLGSLLTCAGLYRGRPGAPIAAGALGLGLLAWVGLEALLGLREWTLLLNGATAAAAVALAAHLATDGSGDATG